MAMNEQSWKRLIQKIQDGYVVPVIGPRVLVDAAGGSLLGEVAAELLRQNGVPEAKEPPPPFRELDHAVSSLRGTLGAQELYDAVNEAFRAVFGQREFAVPAPVRQLAQIAGFRLLVTLTPDDLLARSLRQRCAVNEIVHSPNLPTSEGRDLPVDWQNRPGQAYLLYLFGKTRSAPMFAIHDEDVLEYAHNVIARGGHVPNAFLGELQQRNLLLIGCAFPDWLSRFFLRATNPRRLSENPKRAWLIEQLGPDESLTCFLTSYSKDTEILSERSPAEFVAELHERWMNEYGGGQVVDETPKAESVPRGAMFFISYSRRTDLPRAETLYQSLLRQGVGENEVWFDRNSLEPGQLFRNRILDGVRTCRHFLPLLSRAADDREEAFVFREWEAANDRMPALNREFILPVIVDSEYDPEAYSALPVRPWREKEIDFGHAPEGMPNGPLEAKLKKLVRDARRGS